MTVYTQPIRTKLANSTSNQQNKNRELQTYIKAAFNRQPSGHTMTLSKLLLPLLIILLSGCTAYLATEGSDPGSGIKRIASSVEFVGPNNIRLSEAQYPKDVVLMFPYVSGAIFGNTSDTPVYIVQVDRQLNFSLNLSEKMAEIDKTATSLTEEWLSVGLTVEPGDTRISRIGTFPYSSTNESIGVGGFIDPVSRNTMILVYVDRACEIKGEVDIGREHYSHHLKFSGKGFHWIEIIKNTKNNFILQNYHGNNDIKFSVHIENLQLI
jgi:hypothetical protein